MQTYIVRVYRARPEDEGSVSGMIEDIESGHKQSFNSFIKPQSILADSMANVSLDSLI